MFSGGDAASTGKNTRCECSPRRTDRIAEGGTTFES
jgi:hypothetical protein